MTSQTDTASGVVPGLPPKPERIFVFANNFWTIVQLASIIGFLIYAIRHPEMPPSQYLLLIPVLVNLVPYWRASFPTCSASPLGTMGWGLAALMLLLIMMVTSGWYNVPATLPLTAWIFVGIPVMFGTSHNDLVNRRRELKSAVGKGQPPTSTVDKGAPEL